MLIRTYKKLTEYVDRVGKPMTTTFSSGKSWVIGSDNINNNSILIISISSGLVRVKYSIEGEEDEVSEIFPNVDDDVIIEFIKREFIRPSNLLDLLG
jgi:hypothetical protein